MNSTEPTYDELKQRVRALEEQNQNLHNRVNLLESVLDGIPDVIGIQSLDRRIQYYNQAGYEFLQLGHDQVIGRTCYELIGRDRPCEPCSTLEAIRSGSSSEQEKYFSELDMYLKCYAIPIRNAEGERCYVAEVLTDVTARRRAEEALKKKNYMLEEYFDNLPLLAFNVSFDGTIVDCNRIAVDRLGYQSKDDLVGKPLLSTVYAPSSRQKAKELFDIWKREKKVKNQELQAITREGEIIDVLLNVDTIFDHNGCALYSLSTQLDITDRKNTESSLRESERQFRSLFEDNAVSMMLIDPETGTIPDANRTACRFYGWSRQEMIGKSIFDINMLSREEILAEIDKARTMDRQHFQFKHRLRNGEVRDVDVYSGVTVHRVCHFS